MANKKQIARAAAAEARKAAQAKIDKRNKIIGIIAVLLVAGAALLFALGGGKDTSQPAGPISMNPTHTVQIDVQDYGTITAELYGEAAPITVANFVKLVNKGFYDGLTFHRIISGFMIQGGDPLGNGTGGADQDIKGEFAANGWNKPIAHERGVLSMARSSAPNSASSQFFIMHQAAPHLDGSYAAFGKVLTGLEVVDAICANTPVTDGNGTVLKANQPIITSIRVIENAGE